MVPAPRDVYSAVVKNNTSKDLVVHVIYKMPDGSDLEEKVPVAAQKHVHLEEKLVEKDSMTLVGHIRHLAIEGEVGAAPLVAPFSDVHSPVKDYVVEIEPHGDSLKLHGKLPSA